MFTQRIDTVNIALEEDIVRVRQRTRKLAIECGFSLVDQTKMVTAASELARNAFVFGGGGTVTLEVIQDGGRVGLRLTFEDSGPGIEDIEQAMSDGYTSGEGLGLGLGGAKRLVNEFDIRSQVCEGTTVVITRWK
ncbi:MAG: anti-sigma regulatory factor [Deltaproteobacteria bacterium]|nr:anti-sigma regulatory factor [Deltaproteobacteria bacterium]